MWHVSGNAEIHTWFWSDGQKEKDHVEDLGVDERIKGLLKWILKKCDRGRRAWIGFIWVRKGTRNAA